MRRRVVGDGSAESDLSKALLAIESGPVLPELAYRFCPFPSVRFEKMKHEQVLQFLNFGETHAIRVCDHPIGVEPGSDLDVPPINESLPQSDIRLRERQHQVKSAGPLERWVDPLGRQVRGENVDNTLVHLDPVERSEKYRLVFRLLSRGPVAQGEVHVVEEDDAPPVDLEQGLDG